MIGFDGHTVKQEQQKVDVFIRPGMLATEQLLFKGSGDQQPGQPATDLIVCFKLINDDKFSRQGGNDLIYRHKTSLVDVIQCAPVFLTTLDGRRLRIPVDQVMSPNTVKVVSGEGL